MMKSLTMISIAAILGAITPANAQIVRHQPQLSKTVCLDFVKGSATFNNRAKARMAAGRDWRRKVAIKYSGRFANPQKSIRQIQRVRYDRIEQNWRAVFIAKPCGPRSVLTK